MNFNNTNFTYATTLFIDYLDNLGSNSYSFLQTIDDSTSSIKGHFSIKDTANVLNYAMFAITGSLAPDTDHFDVPVSWLSGVTSFTNGTNTIITFARTGDIGQTGYTGSVGIGYTGSAAASTFSNGQSISVANVTITQSLIANNTGGNSGQLLFSNGTGIYWANTPTTVTYANVNVTTITANSLASDYINIGVGYLTIGNSTVNTTISNNYFRVSNTTSNVVYSLTDFRVPVGNTAQRPANATTGYIRFNTDTTDLEYASNSTQWYSITTQETLTSNNINITNTINIGNTATNTVITNASVRTTTANVSVINATGNVIISGNNSVFKVPVGTTAQRPSPAATGYIRFNTDTTDLEYAANSTQWYSITTQETLTSNNINITNQINIGNTATNTTISSTNVSTTYVNTRYIVANNVIGSNGSILTSNSTGGIYWSNTITANNSKGAAGSVLTSNGNGMYWSNAVNTLTATSLVANSMVADSIDIGIGWLTVGNSTVNTQITNTSIGTSIATMQTVYFTSDLSTPFSTWSTTLDSSTPKSVTIPTVALNSATGTGYTVEFFVKFTSLSTSSTLDAYGSTGVNSLGWSANTSTISLYNNGYSGAGSVTGLNLQNDTWYHMAYIGYNGGTYFAINGIVKNLNTIGGYNGYDATGTWTGGWSKLTGDATYSNFRIVTGRNIYSVVGFTAPQQALAFISGTQLLALKTQLFWYYNAASGGSSYAGLLTRSGSPLMSADNISLSTGVLTVAGSIQNGILDTPSIYTKYLYAGESLGTDAQVLSSNSTGGIYWSSVIGYAGSKGTTGYTGSIGSLGYTGSFGNTGFTGSVGYAGSVGSLGYTGSVGYTGSFGSIGYTGSQGTAGYTGSFGYTGSQGDTGYVGSIGSVGYTGSIGAGYTGSSGSGYVGSVGYTGSSGSVGYTGSSGGGGSSVTVSATVPVSPSAGNLWWNTETGSLYIYYDDGDSQQWVSASPSPAASAVKTSFGYSIIFGGY